MVIDRHSMAKGVSYAEAVKLLDSRENRIVAALDKVLGGLLLGAAATGAGFAVSLFDPKSDLVRLGKDLIRSMTRSGTRSGRTEQLAAAHTVIVLTAYFEVLQELDLPFDIRELELTAEDQVGMIVNLDVPIPAPQRPYEAALATTTAFYKDITVLVSRFVKGLAVWDDLDETQREWFNTSVRDVLPARATTRYEELFRRLATDFPEVAFWANLVDHQATRAEISTMKTGLAGLAAVLQEIKAGGLPDDRRLALNRAYHSVLSEPILSSMDVPAGLRLPLIGDTYVNPDFRAAQVDAADRLAEEAWWDRHPVRDDLQAFLLGHLTSPQAAEAPLLVLGHPGSGKSMLTHIIAARLPPSEFLTVRVVLRDMPVDLDLQEQIERAIRTATGENLAWPDLVRSAGDALPLVLLDGFDEWLQATGVSQSDYLGRVATFQRREAALGRPVAVLVTSRTAVADRARPVDGMVAVRIEPFRAAHVEQWLGTWNSANAAGFQALGLRPLPVERVLAHADLASQPLLLVMLAIYDTDGNSLQRDDVPFSQAELYERLLVRFAEREVRKSAPDLAEDQFRHAVDQELLRLSLVAFAMFNRGRQWCREAELDTDLAALFGTPDAVGAGFRAGLTAAQVVIGRFFFIHQAQALSDDRNLRSYEFLHATFGEYLVVRLLTRELDDLVTAALLKRTRIRSSMMDDSFLYVLLSFAPLSIRDTIVSFLAEYLGSLSAVRRGQLREMLLEIFHRSLDPRRSGELDDYWPVRMSMPARYATYSANLVLITVLCGRTSTRELFPDAEFSVDEWRRTALLWRSQLPAGGWHRLVELIALRREWDEDLRVAHLQPADDETPAADDDPYWSYHIVPSDPYRKSTWFGWVRNDNDQLRSQGHFLCDSYSDTLAHALEPLAGELGNLVVSFFAFEGERPVSAANALISLWVTSCRAADPVELAAAHDICLGHVVFGFEPYDTDTIRRFRSMYFHQLARC